MSTARRLSGIVVLAHIAAFAWAPLGCGGSEPEFVPTRDETSRRLLSTTTVSPRPELQTEGPHT